MGTAVIVASRAGRDGDGRGPAVRINGQTISYAVTLGRDAPSGQEV
ncbi:hypothetical protein GCM10009858_08760 [Terrabacter carboxydivorans]|uniref:Uncharacterized protein n=1 Tax=Terrabacter carboxydivorans TaxID=619730 RepID=A0ABN3KZU8_9MICO